MARCAAIVQLDMSSSASGLSGVLCGITRKPTLHACNAGGGASKGAPTSRNSAAATNKKLTDLYRRRRKDVSGRGDRCVREAWAKEWIVSIESSFAQRARQG
eukprot:scaffold254155_cov18-Tisochrysis_lutea.AAC.1